MLFFLSVFGLKALAQEVPQEVHLDEPSFYEPKDTYVAAYIIVILLFIFYLLLCVIPMSMAKKRGRSRFGWFLLSVFTSPLVGMILLAFLGETDERRRERIREEEEIRRSVAANN